MPGHLGDRLVASLHHGEAMWSVLINAQGCLWEPALQRSGFEDPHIEDLGLTPLNQDMKDRCRWILCNVMPIPHASDAVYSRRAVSVLYSGESHLSRILDDYMNTELSIIITNIQFGIRSRSDRFYDRAMDPENAVTLPEVQRITFDEWRRQCRRTGKPVNSLRYILIADVNKYENLETKLVFDEVGSRSPSYQLNKVVGPPDPAFYAILGVVPVAAIVDVLVFHQRSLATKNWLTGAIEKVKSIREITFTDTGLEYVQVIITLEDVDPRDDAEFVGPRRTGWVMLRELLFHLRETVWG